MNHHVKRQSYGRDLLSNFLSRWKHAEPNGQPAPIGLIAGWGSFPVQVAEEIVSSGGRVCCIAITGHASPELESICDHVKWSGVGKIGAHLRYFRRHHVRNVTMAGKLFKSDLLFQGSVWLKHFPDLTAIRTFGPCLLGKRRDSRDDSLLLSVTRTYAKNQMNVCPATDFAPELLVKKGQLIGAPLDERQQRDATSGWQVAKQMGGMDIGQSITIKDATVLAVEAVEGTDACIERTGKLCRRGGWTLVKVSKPNQDMRFDVPTIGPQTIQKVAANGGETIVIEAGMTIVVEREETLRLAKQHGIKIVAFEDAAMEQQPGGIQATNQAA
ncbi:UDP-2,3-diacylglucosamine diphosphatase LpxI [Stieleria sp. JC731]|uniref:LpxI family protein n=1 Tax=Pirellulaceae TaxID=2691357 RepID=UPI001E5C0E79|nr:UDP-2,3-diacylglucosamine diphosphatase LpxI [Stieleria sp. JC731]MCC9600172.1 UDP-2,3-diacylglucosamine diphosphatase LpxI [Stieleria sp. JC731]